MQLQLDFKDERMEDVVKYMLEKRVIEYDKETNTITVNADIAFKFKGNLNIDCDKHIVMSSGMEEDPEREDGAKYSIWLNPELDREQKPVLYAPLNDVEY